MTRSLRLITNRPSDAQSDLPCTFASSQLNPKVVTRLGSSSLRARRAYTLLELMIALALLSVLMLLGWGMMESLQRSQERSWKLTQRVRVLRLTRNWLSNDLDHLAKGTAQGSLANDPLAGSVSFEGDVSGFIASVIPSLDPIPFLQRLGESSDPTSTNGALQDLSLESMTSTAEEAAMEQWKSSIWGSGVIDVEYRLEPVESDSDSQPVAEVQDPDSIQYELVRREWIPQSYFDNYLAANQPANGIQTPRLSRRGSGDSSTNSSTPPRGSNLESLIDDESQWIPPLSETRLYGVVKPKFHFSDGITWLSEWSSTTQGGLPRAVAITFDFPPTSEFKKPIPPPKDSESDSSETDSDEMENPLFDPEANATSELLEPKSGNERLMDISESTYVIIVETGRRDRMPIANPSSPSLGGNR